jgi:deoxyribose-phosphate aldolase
MVVAHILEELRSADPASVDATLLADLLAAVEPVDEVTVAQRTAQLWSRSIKGPSQADALDLAVRCVDLTTLEGTDTDGRISALVAKAVHPDPTDPSCPSAAAVCVHPDLVASARAAVAAHPAAGRLEVAAVATGFPMGRTSTSVKVSEVAAAVAAGADEVDIVIDRAALLAGDVHTVFSEVRAAADICHGGDARLKTILETGELGSLDMVARAAALACWAGSDFIKTSTGKISEGATPATSYVLVRTAVRFAQLTGVQVGVKAAGGIRSAKDAVRYLVMVNECGASEWLDPHWWRFGASSLLNDLVAQRAHLSHGRYFGPDHFTIG